MGSPKIAYKQENYSESEVMRGKAENSGINSAQVAAVNSLRTVTLAD